MIQGAESGDRDGNAIPRHQDRSPASRFSNEGPAWPTPSIARDARGRLVARRRLHDAERAGVTLHVAREDGIPRGEHRRAASTAAARTDVLLR